MPGRRCRERDMRRRNGGISLGMRFRCICWRNGLRILTRYGGGLILGVYSASCDATAGDLYVF
jgi:hypothetical protein